MTRMVNGLAQISLRDPIAYIDRIGRGDCADLLSDWEHPLGPCNRPFGVDRWALVVAHRPVAVAVTASIVSPTLRDDANRTWQRREVVELARIARHPDEPWSMRVMLRLWREALVSEWPHWNPDLLVSYALPGTTGDLYRFDGWTKVREVKPSSPGAGSTWSKPSKSDRVADGRKTLWVYHRTGRTLPSEAERRGVLAL
jgi:hypothetical protein